MKNIALIFLLLACPLLNAASVDDILAYKNSGDSSAWYQELAKDAYDPEKMAATEAMVLQAMKSPGISDDAFRLCAKILKPCASEKYLPELAGLISNEKRVAPVFDVLISFPGKKSDDVLLELLKSKDKNIASHAAYALGMRKTAAAVQPLLALGKSKDKRVSDAAITAIGHIGTVESAKALKILASQKSADKFLVNYALAETRESLIASKNMKAALAISLSDEFRPGLLSLFELQGMKAMDSLIAKNSEVARNAARVANEGRKYENSQELLKAYDSLEPAAKAVALRLFGLSGDKKFLPLVRNELKAKKNPLAIEAMYACAYIGNSSIVPSLLNFAKNEDRAIYDPARYALTFMAEPIDGILEKEYAKSRDFRILEILINRGNIQYRNELISRFFDEADDARANIIKVMERQVGYVCLPEIAKRFNNANADVKKDCMRLFIKALSRDREIDFRNMVFEQTLSGAKFSESELGIIKSRVLTDKKKK
ncbi:MAG: HEAT repeat domain-containing protein [Opitutales bacterium]|nr:HEAT repeat domain-containing protein [Opitutales bacterium]